MLVHTALPDEKTSLPLPVPQVVAPQRSAQLRWTGLGLAVFMLIGFSSCALHPFASHASAKSSRLVQQVAFNTMPGLGPSGSRAAAHPVSSHVRPTGHVRTTGFVPTILGGSPRASTQMNAWLNSLEERSTAKGSKSSGSYSPRMNDGPRVSWTISDDIPCEVDRPMAECLQAAGVEGYPSGDAGKGPRSSWTTQISEDIPCLVDQPMAECLAAANARHGLHNPRMNDGPRNSWTTEDGPLRATDDRYVPGSRPAAYGSYDPKKRPAASSALPPDYTPRTKRPQDNMLGGPRGSWTTEGGPLRSRQPAP
jgi:hypothetical protein